MGTNFTIKIDINPKPNRAGLYSLFITITSKSKRLRLSTGQCIDRRYWNNETHTIKPNCPHGATITSIIRKKITDVETWILEQQQAGKTVTLSFIKSTYGRDHSLSVDSFFSWVAEAHRDKVEIGTYNNWQMEINRINEFDPDCHVQDINHIWLKRYNDYLIGKNMSENTRHKCFKILAKFLNAAIVHGVIKKNPMDGYKRPRYRQTDRTYLTGEEVERIEKVILKPIPDYMRRACLYFLLGCYSGLRVSDWQRFTPDWIDSGRMMLRAKKNGEIVSMKVHTRLAAVISKLKDAGDCDREQKVNEYLKSIAKLAGIKKNLTTHVARHSFAVRCAELEIPKETCAELMGISSRTADYYYKITARSLDQAMERWG